MGWIENKGKIGEVRGKCESVRKCEMGRENAKESEGDLHKIRNLVCERGSETYRKQEQERDNEKTENETE